MTIRRRRPSTARCGRSSGTNGSSAQQGPKLIGSNFVGVTSQQGNSVALSGDGNTLIEGAPGDNNSLGAVWAFSREGSTWSQETLFPLVGVGATGASGQGFQWRYQRRQHAHQRRSERRQRRNHGRGVCLYTVAERAERPVAAAGQQAGRHGLYRHRGRTAAGTERGDLGRRQHRRCGRFRGQQQQGLRLHLSVSQQAQP